MGLASPGGGLIVGAGLVELAQFLQEMIGETQVCLEADRAARVALDDRFPDLKGLFIFSHLESGIPRLQELAGGPVFNDGSAFCGCRLLGNGHREEGGKGKAGEE